MLWLHHSHRFRELVWVSKNSHLWLQSPMDSAKCVGFFHSEYCLSIIFAVHSVLLIAKVIPAMKGKLIRCTLSSFQYCTEFKVLCVF